MTIPKNLFASALLLSAAVAGCAGDAAGPGNPDDPNNPDNPGNPGDPLPTAVDATGQYHVRSAFNLATNAPGTVGTVSRAIIDATDSPDDPTKWILDQIVGAMPDGAVKSALMFASGLASGVINDYLVSNAPDFVLTMRDVGNEFGQITTQFGVNETFDITKSGDSYAAVHTVLGAHFKINNVESDHAFADFGTPNITVQNVGVTIDAAGQMTLANHTVSLQFGKVLRIALDGEIIPRFVTIDPASPKSKLQQLLESKINCPALGMAVGNRLGNFLLSAQTISTVTGAACSAGMAQGANFIYSKIDAVDASALDFALAGTARITDTNSNHQLDTIQTGAWTGTLSYAGTPAPLGAATFVGSRQ